MKKFFEKSNYLNEDSLIKIGNELFKNSRSRNELESKSVDNFFRSKTITIFRKNMRKK